MTMNIYADLSKRFPVLSEFVFEYDSIKYVNIRQMESQYPDEVELSRLLYEWEFGNEFNTNVSLPHYMNCSSGLIKKWLNAIDNTRETVILDSVWLQNPINELLFRNADAESIFEYCVRLTEAFKEFDMRCIYLKRKNVVQSVDFAFHVKGDSWANRVVEHISKTPYGLANDLRGVECIVEFFQVRKEIEENVLSRGIMKSKEYLIENNDWHNIREQIKIDFSIS
jgi:hypothetical protein